MAGLTLPVLLAALTFGAVHDWAKALASIVVWFVAFVLLGFSRGSARAPRAFVWWGAILFVYLQIQLVPLPREWIATLSPGAEEIYRVTLDPLASWGIVAGGANARGSTAALALDPFGARAEWLCLLAAGVLLGLSARGSAPAAHLRALVAVGAGLAFLALLQGATWNGRILWVFAPYDLGVLPTQERLSGPFVNPDHFAAFLQMLVAPGAALWIRELRQARATDRDPGTWIRDSLFFGIALAVMGAALIGTASRGGISGASLGILVLWASHPLWRLGAGEERAVPPPAPASLARRAAPVVVGLAVVIASVFYAGAKSIEVLDERARSSSWADLELRATMWRETIDVLAEFPVFGVGLGGWRDAVQRHQRYPDAGYRPNHAHNEVLEWGSEVGLAGIALTATVLLGLVRWISRVRSSLVIRWGIAGAAAGLLWQSSFDFPLRVPANAFLLASLLGLACNPNWRRWRQPPIRRLALRRMALAVATIVLTFMSLIHLGEGLLWIRVRADHVPATDISPRNAETWLHLAANRRRASSSDSASVLDALGRAVERRPAYAQALHEIGVTASDPAIRREATEAAVFLAPTQGTWRAFLAYLLATGGDRERALEELEAATHRDPTFSHHPYLGPQHRLDPAAYGAAERGFVRALEARPADPWLLRSVAAFYHRMERWDRAAELYERSAEINGDWRGIGELAARCRAKLAQFAEAENDVRRSIAADPTRLLPYDVLAREVLKPQGKFDEAIAVLDAAIEHSPHRLPIVLAMSDVYMAKGDRIGMIAALTRAADLSPTDAELRFRLGRVALEAGDPEGAAEAFLRASRIRPGVAYFHAFRALALERANRHFEAREALETAIRLDPGNPTYRNRWRMMERRKGATREGAADDSASPGTG